MSLARAIVYRDRPLRDSGASSGILWLATQGSAHLDAERMRFLLRGLDAVEFPFDRGRKLRSAARLLRALLAARPRLVVMEGTGLAGGVTLLIARAMWGVPFIVSSGDAVGPYVRMRSRFAGPLAGWYERLLCRHSAGYIGWTPYLVGRALTFGAPRAMTAPGWARTSASAGARVEVRERLGIAPEALVIGLVGTLNWRERVGYVYGAELVRAIRSVGRTDVVALIVGDGPGRGRLEDLAQGELGSRVLLPGAVPSSQVADYLAAFDVASLPQSVDGVGAFRYSTKLSEYLAAGLPIITGQIPAAYDLDDGAMWRLPGSAPWSDTYLRALTGVLESLNADEIERRRPARTAGLLELFDPRAQQLRVKSFIHDVLSQREA